MILWRRTNSYTTECYLSSSFRGCPFHSCRFVSVWRSRQWQWTTATTDDRDGWFWLRGLFRYRAAAISGNTRSSLLGLKAGMTALFVIRRLTYFEPLSSVSLKIATVTIHRATVLEAISRRSCCARVGLWLNGPQCICRVQIIVWNSTFVYM